MDHINTLTQTTSRHSSRSSPVASIHNEVNSTSSNVAPALSSLIHSQSLTSSSTSTSSSSSSSAAVAPTAPVSIVTSTSSLSNLFDGFTSRVTGDLVRGVGPSSSAADLANTDAGSGGVTSGSLVSLTSIGSLGTTANAFYSSIGLAFNSLTSPITAAAAAAHATGAEAAAVVVAAASAISNHLSSPTNGTPPNLDDEIDDDDEDEEEEDCEDYEDEKEDDDNSHVAASTTKKSWTEIKAAVNEMRKQLSNMSSLVPTNIQFRNLSDGRVRCYFLSTPPNAWETTLLYTDININNTNNSNNITNTTTTISSSLSLDPTVAAAAASTTSTIKNNSFITDSNKRTMPGVSKTSNTNTTTTSNPVYVTKTKKNNKSSPAITLNHKQREFNADTKTNANMILDEENKRVGDNISQPVSPQPTSLSLLATSPTQNNCFSYNNQSTNQHQHLNQLQQVEPITKRLHWNIVLQQPISNVVIGVMGGVGGSNIWSREYQLLQERKRLSRWGITSYELHKLSGKIVFPCLSDLYQCLDTGFNAIPLFPTQLRTCPQWAALDPQICPQNSDLIAYISGCDIWVTHTLSGHEERLTFAHDGRRPFADDPLSAGVPSYVMQEEFSRYQGYWWQPTTNDGIYRIVYEEVDESDVCLYTFPSSQAMPGEMEEYRFPRTGTNNAKSKLKIVQFTLSESLRISDVCIKDLPYSLTSVLPWLEYIVRVGWTPDSKYVWIQAMNRKQQRLDVVLIPLDNFCETYSSSSTPSPSGSVEHSWRISYCRTMTPLQVIYSQVSDSWINVHDLLYFLEITDETVTFLWGSEETGYRHLYLITSSLIVIPVNGCRESNLMDNKTTANATPINVNHCNSSCSSSNKVIKTQAIQQAKHFLRTSKKNTNTINTNNNSNVIHMETNNSGDYFESSALNERIINKVALTSGEWEVLGRNLWVDKNQLLVYFLGLRDTPLEKHLYVVSLQRPEHIRLLTEPGYSYLVEFDETCQLMMQVYCNIQRLPSCKVVRVEQMCQNGGVNAIHLSLVGYLHEGGKSEPQYCPQIFRPQLPSGEVVYAMVFKPHNFQLGVKYPAVLNVYGGPEVQTVNNTFKGKQQLRMHMLAAQGYCVICIDSRGSRHRGLKFESYLRCRMGQVELTDQVDALRILADQLGYIDMDRVAIHGWSYGGYLSLMGLVQYPEMFKVAIAGAPVTNWEYYDTGYTERYMDLPQNNKHGYTAGSVLNYIHAFPEEENRLLLIHGLIDENVHFYHTSQLIAALNKANKPYDLHIFPHERHSLRNLESNKNYETKLLSFLQNL